MELKGCSKVLFRCLTVLLLLVITANLQQPVQAASAVDVTIHYVPAPGDERDWDLWVWTNNQDGEAYSFQHDDQGGKVASFQLPAPTKSLNYVVRLPDWSARDCVSERKLEVVDGKAQAWLKGGTCDVSLVNPNQSDEAAMQDQRDEEKLALNELPDAGYGGASFDITPTLICFLIGLTIIAYALRKRKLQ